MSIHIAIYVTLYIYVHFTDPFVDPALALYIYEQQDVIVYVRYLHAGISHFPTQL